MDTANGLVRLPSGIPGFDEISRGGLPEGRMTLVAGTTGSGKTVMCGQFLAAGVSAGEPGVFVTFEERPEGIRQNLASFGWDIARWEDAGLWAFVDSSPRHDVDVSYLGSYDLSPLVARVRDAVTRVGAKRVAIDTIGSLLAQFEAIAPVRQAMFKLAAALGELGVTSLMTSERTDDYGPVTRLGFEEFVVDNVVILRNALAGEKRRRTIEVLKLRGADHVRGEHLFTIQPAEGMLVVPISVVGMATESSTNRLTTGNSALDDMVTGGLYEKSITLVAGSTGTGKSMLAFQFIAGARRDGHRALLLSFEESHDQLVRNAAGCGFDLESMEQDGSLQIVAAAPESASIEDHLQRLTTLIDEFSPDRVAIDSLTALERVATVTGFRDYVLGLASHIRRKARLGLFTSTTLGLVRPERDDSLHLWTSSDTIFLLQYHPVDGEVRRGINVLKMRGSDHDKVVREFTLSNAGMEIRGRLSATTAFAP